MELMDEVLDSQEKEGFRPLILNRFRRKDRLLLLFIPMEVGLLFSPMLVKESEMATWLPKSLPVPVAPPEAVEPAAAAASTAARALMRSRGVIGSDIVPLIYSNEIIDLILIVI